MKSHVVYASSALLGNEMTFIKLKKKNKKKNVAYGLYKFNYMFYFAGIILLIFSDQHHQLHIKCSNVQKLYFYKIYISSFDIKAHTKSLKMFENILNK